MPDKAKIKKDTQRKRASKNKTSDRRGEETKYKNQDDDRLKNPDIAKDASPDDFE